MQIAGNVAVKSIYCPAKSFINTIVAAATMLVLVQANALIEKLQEDGEEFEKEFYFTAGYDAPFK